MFSRERFRLFVTWNVHIIVIIIIIICKFLQQFSQVVFHIRLSHGNSRQVFKTRFLAYFYSVVIYVISSLPPLSSSSSVYSRSLRTNAKAPPTIGIPITFMFHGFSALISFYYFTIIYIYIYIYIYTGCLEIDAAHYYDNSYCIKSSFICDCFFKTQMKDDLMQCDITSERSIQMKKAEIDSLYPTVNWLIGQMSRAFTNGPGDLGSISGQVIPKTVKIVLDTSLLNTHRYKVRLKGKVAIEKGAF